MKVLVAVDQTPESHLALRYACHLLEHFDASIEALYVKQDVAEIILEDFDVPFLKKTDHKQKIEAQAKQVQDEIENACQICFTGKIPCLPRVVVGDPAEEIMEEAKSGNYDLLVLGSHGRSSLKGLLLGTIHSKVLHHTDRPVLIVRDLREIQKVLVAYRGTRCDRAALEFIAPLLARRKPEITVLHVQESHLGEDQEFARACLLGSDKILNELGHSPVSKSAEGNFIDITLDEIKAGNYDLVVLGAYGHQRAKKLRLISDEAINIVSRTTRPVLVYRDPSDS